MQGYQAIREAVAIVDLDSRGLIRATGEDRVRLLHAMVTNHVEQLSDGQGCYAFFLNAQGRILADVNLMRLADCILLDTEPETREKVYAHLDKYIIADDVTLEDVTGQTATIGLEGPKTPELISSLGNPVPGEPHDVVRWDKWLVSRLSVTGLDGYRFHVPSQDKAGLVEQLTGAGAIAATAEEIRTVRLENGRPRYGEDITESNLPQETQLLNAVHFNKGCYLGQEIVERIHSQGHVNRLLVRLHVNSSKPPRPGSKLEVEGREIGEITSAAVSPSQGCVVALAYVKEQFARDGVECNLTQAEAPATASVLVRRPS